MGGTVNIETSELGGAAFTLNFSKQAKEGLEKT
jgi:hypothetical protein